VGEIAAAGDADEARHQAATAEEQEIAVADFGGDVGEVDLITHGSLRGEGLRC
jgi:hypothetical protein